MPIPAPLPPPPPRPKPHAPPTAPNAHTRKGLATVSTHTALCMSWGQLRTGPVSGAHTGHHTPTVVRRPAHSTPLLYPAHTDARRTASQINVWCTDGWGAVPRHSFTRACGSWSDSYKSQTKQKHKPHFPLHTHRHCQRTARRVPPLRCSGWPRCTALCPRRRQRQGDGCQRGSGTCRAAHRTSRRWPHQSRQHRKEEAKTAAISSPNENGEAVVQACWGAGCCRHWACAWRLPCV
jgi:hypothetical protein